MWLVAKSVKGHEYVYVRTSAIACRGKKQAEEFAKWLNNISLELKDWMALNEHEVWFAHEYDEYDAQPNWRVRLKKSGAVEIIERS